MPDVSSLPTPEAPPVLSTPDTRILDEFAPEAAERPSQKTDEAFAELYEIDRIASELLEGGWHRVALQFPDHLLVDAPRVSSALSHCINDKAERRLRALESDPPAGQGSLPETRSPQNEDPARRDEVSTAAKPRNVRLFILADTSYGACCVDEVAAEHADAEVVVHYGRACLSPTARLPVVYCYTKQLISQDAMVEAFSQRYQNHNEKIILMSDLPCQWCLELFSEKLTDLGYRNLFVTSVIQEAQSLLPNRTTPPVSGNLLQDWSLFHLSEPTAALLLTLTSRVGSMTFYPTTSLATCTPPQALETSTTAVLRRRYALLTSLAIVPIFGILVNTLSVRNYMQILKHVKDVIAAAGKKSYTFVVGKVNAAKIANFSEVGGWVVIGCWESSLFDSKDFWKPIITPFELTLALQPDDQRQWSGNWTSNFEDLLRSHEDWYGNQDKLKSSCQDVGCFGHPRESGDIDSEEESSPPEFDLRTGRYVSHSRPMGRMATANNAKDSANESRSQALTRRSPGDLIRSENFSPAAQHLQTQRTWQGLGSDLVQSSDNGDVMDGAAVEQGRHGIARGYQTQLDSTTR